MKSFMRQFLAVFAVVLSAGPTYSGNLEECAVQGLYYQPLLCPTALEFGWQASQLREAHLAHFATVDRPADDGLVLSSSGTQRVRTGFALAGAQRTFGSFNGAGQNLILGHIWSSGSNLGFGLTALLGNSNVTPPSGPQVSKQELLLGPFASATLANGDFVYGQLLIGRANYRLNNVPSQGTSAIGTVTWSRQIAKQRFSVIPFVSLAIKHDRPNATDWINATVLTGGASVQSAPKQVTSGYRINFASLELDLGRYQDSFTNNITYAALRGSVGTNHVFDNGGVLGVSVGATLASDRTAIASAQLRYRITF